MEVINDSSCSWINDLNKRSNIQIISSDLDSEWLIVGAGYTGLSAARKLGQLYPNEKIILVDAQLAGEGASSRNSGYLVIGNCILDKSKQNPNLKKNYIKKFELD